MVVRRLLAVALRLLPLPHERQGWFSPSKICWAARYADVVVHRLLAAALRLLPLPDAVREREEMHALADNLNTRHRGAQACRPTQGLTHPARLSVLVCLQSVG